MMLYTISQAALAMGVNYNRVYYQINTHKLNPLNAGRSRLLTEEHLKELKLLIGKGVADEHAIR